MHARGRMGKDAPHADPNCSEAKSHGPHTGGPRLSRPCPWVARPHTREGRACRGRSPGSQHAVTGPGARSTHADTPHADPNCSEAKSRAPTREGRTPARPGGPSAASATARRTRAHPRRAARETPRHRPRPPIPTGHKCRTFRTAIHEQQPNRHFQPRHTHPRPRIRQQKYEQNTRKGVPEPQTCRRHHQHSGRSRVDIKHYYINVQRIIRPEDFVISRIGICPSFVFFVPRTT